jgi:hypothetical protein
MLAKAKKRPSLLDQIEDVRRECQDLIDERAARIKQDCDNLPLDTIKLSITRGLGCHCASVKRLLEESN